MEKIKKFLGIGKANNAQQDSAGASYESETKLSLDDLAGSESASKGVGSGTGSTKAVKNGHHHHHHKKHGSGESKSVGSDYRTTKTTGYASDRVDVAVDASKYGKSGRSVELGASPLYGEPSKGASDVGSVRQSGLVDPYGNRLSKDDIKMLKLMLTQVLKSYIAHIEVIYSDENINIEKELVHSKSYATFLKKYKADPNQVSEGDKEYFLGNKSNGTLSFQERIKEAKIDEETKPKLIKHVQEKIESLCKEIDKIHKGSNPQSASAFLTESMKNPLDYKEGHTQRYFGLLKDVLHISEVSDFSKTLNAFSADFEAHKDEVLDGVGDIKTYSAKQSKKLVGARMRGSSTTYAEMKKLFRENTEFKDAINSDEVILAANKNGIVKDDEELVDLVKASETVASRVFAIIEKKKLTKNIESAKGFGRASGISSKHAQKLKSKSSITFSDLMSTFMEINIGVGEQATKILKPGEGKDGELHAKWAGTRGALTGPAGDAITADLFLMFTYVANAMNEMKAIQKAQPDVVRSRAIKLAAMVNSMTVSAHAFTNGNGRTCRLFADAILEAFGLPPASVNTLMTSVGGKFGHLYVDDEVNGKKAFDRSTEGYLEGVKASSRLLGA